MSDQTGIKIIESEDGSHTLYLPGLNETYHSTHGAIRESEHVFIQAGLAKKNETIHKITILEVGLGTGLNVLLTYQYAQAHSIEIEFHTIEPYPLEKIITEQLNYVDLIGEKALVPVYKQIHASAWEIPIALNDSFSLVKHKTTLQDFDPTGLTFDLIYFDAFAPGKQPEVWSLDNFLKIYASTISSGILVSYCASGQFKRNLKEVGFQIQSLPGPPGKKEMTRAEKI